MPNFLKNFWPGLTWWGIVLFLTLSPGNFYPRIHGFWSLFSPDKLVHFFLYAVLTYLLLNGAGRQYRNQHRRYKTLLPVLAAFLTGIITELLQAWLPIGRDATIYDAVANTFGSFAGFWLFIRLKNKNGKYVPGN